MRLFWTAASVVALAVLPACAAYQTEARPPTVSYSYIDDDDYAEVAQMAEDYCEDNYGRDAELLDREEDGDDFEATFACD